MKARREDQLTPLRTRERGAASADAPGRPQPWSTWRQAARTVAWRPHMLRTTFTAVVVGTILFAINQLDVVLAGHATTGVWVKTGVTYLVPFAVSNIGILIATHHKREPDA
jgi:hypothetical protein